MQLHVSCQFLSFCFFIVPASHYPHFLCFLFLINYCVFRSFVTANANLWLFVPVLLLAEDFPGIFAFFPADFLCVFCSFCLFLLWASLFVLLICGYFIIYKPECPTYSATKTTHLLLSATLT